MIQEIRIEKTDRSLSVDQRTWAWFILNSDVEMVEGMSKYSIGLEIRNCQSAQGLDPKYSTIVLQMCSAAWPSPKMGGYCKVAALALMIS